MEIKKGDKVVMVDMDKEDAFFSNRKDYLLKLYEVVSIVGIYEGGYFGCNLSSVDKYPQDNPVVVQTTNIFD